VLLRATNAREILDGGLFCEGANRLTLTFTFGDSTSSRVKDKLKTRAGTITGRDES